MKTYGINYKYIYFKANKPLWGDVDIIVNAYDTISPSTDKMNPYKMSYQITHNSRDGFKPGDELTLWVFENLLPSGNDIECETNVHNIYRNDGFGGECDSSNDRFWYIVTNTEANDSACWDTNTKDKATDAKKNDEAKYPDGEVTFNIKAYDIKNNLHSLPVTVILDNFAPYVKEVKIEQDGKEKGDISKPLKSGEAIFTIIFSESMDTTKTPNITFGLKSPYNQHKLTKRSWSKTDYDNDTYKATFYIPENQAKDYDGNSVIFVNFASLCENRFFD